MYNIGIAMKEGGELRLNGSVKVPNLPAIGDQFKVNNIVEGKPVVFYGEVTELIAHPLPQFPGLDAIMVVRTSEAKAVQSAQS